MAAAGTLATDAQILLAIGADATATQILGTNTDIWILIAESEMEKEAGNNVGLVTNYATINAAHKQWLAGVASHRAAFHAIQNDQNAWQLATTQSKLNVINDIWQAFKKDIKLPDIIADMGL